MRVGIDAVSAAGKTTFAAALVPHIDAPVVRALVVDGIWLHKPELRDAFDLTIWLAIDRQVALERAIARDAARMESVDAARRRYATRYFPGETRYLEEVDPESIADLVVDTS